ncbi:hypothetical protein [Niallia sp. FSL W8-0954]
MFGPLIPFGNNVSSDENSVGELMMTHIQLSQLNGSLIKKSLIGLGNSG